MAAGTFRSLRVRNYRIYAGGAIVSNIGTWMQRIGQDWLVLTELTQHKASAVGIVMGLQYGPQLALLPVTGYFVDHFDRRRILLVTQSLLGLLALGLGLLTIARVVSLWEVDVFALLLGCVSAFDAPTRQTFVGELVDREHLSNAVGLNSTSFNLGRTVGPAIAGLLIAAIGTGWVFLLNAASFIGVLGAIFALRVEELHLSEKPKQRSGGVADGVRYILARPDLRTNFLMFGIIGLFGLNFPIFLSKMAVSVFHLGADGFGLLTSAMALGSVAGALLSARRERPTFALLLISSAIFGTGLLLAAVAPNPWAFAPAMMMVGIASQTFTTSSSSMIQLSTDPAMRGRVIAIMLGVAVGTTPLGAPIVGWIADHFGARWALVCGGAAGIASLLIGLRYARARQEAPIPAQP